MIFTQKKSLDTIKCNFLHYFHEYYSAKQVIVVTKLQLHCSCRKCITNYIKTQLTSGTLYGSSTNKLQVQMSKDFFQHELELKIIVTISYQ